MSATVKESYIYLSQRGFATRGYGYKPSNDAHVWTKSTILHEQSARNVECDPPSSETIRAEFNYLDSVEQSCYRQHEAEVSHVSWLARNSLSKSGSRERSLKATTTSYRLGEACNF